MGGGHADGEGGESGKVLGRHLGACFLLRGMAWGWQGGIGQDPKGILGDGTLRIHLQSQQIPNSRSTWFRSSVLTCSARQRASLFHFLSRNDFIEKVFVGVIWTLGTLVPKRPWRWLFELAIGSFSFRSR